VPEDFDYNGLMLNPKWGQQVNGPGTFPNPLPSNPANICPSKDFRDATCTSPNQVSGIDTPTHSAFVCVWGGAGSHRYNGHVNWTAATYTGTVCWEGASADGDYDWNLKSDGGAGLTTENHPRPNQGHPEYIHVEYDYRETLGGEPRSPLWERFHRFLDPTCSGGGPFTCDEAAGLRMVDGSRAVVTGLVGLDSEHGGYTELHPVFAMAVQVSPNPATPDREDWMMFARNWGNEGFCSHRIHSLPPEMTTLKVLIPLPQTTGTITGAELASDFFSFDSDDCPTAVFIRDRGILITFQTPTDNNPTNPIRRPLISGEVRIRWHTSGTITAPTRPACPGRFRQEFREEQRQLRREMLLSGLGRFARQEERSARIQHHTLRDPFNQSQLSHCNALSGDLQQVDVNAPTPRPIMIRSTPDTFRSRLDKFRLEVLQRFNRARRSRRDR
jgi:hypothetical protein